jgi:hypothetical protein
VSRQPLGGHALITDVLRHLPASAQGRHAALVWLRSTCSRAHVGVEEAARDLVSDHMEVHIGGSPYISDDATEFIVSGPDGATLAKVGQGFLLVEGEAYLLQTAVP